MNFKFEFHSFFLNKLKTFDNNFLDLIENRLTHLRKDPLKYSSILILSKNIYSLKVSNINYDTKLIFRVENEIIYLLYIYELEENIKDIMNLFE